MSAKLLQGGTRLSNTWITCLELQVVAMRASQVQYQLKGMRLSGSRLFFDEGLVLGCNSGCEALASV